MDFKKSVRFSCLVLVTFIAVISTAYAATPGKINYQGHLEDSGGVPLNTTVSITFAIYNSPSGGSALWNETRDVTVADGDFSVVLGEVTLIDLPFDEQYYLGITVGADPEMTPRQTLTKVPYAFRAYTADAVVAQGITGSMIANATITPDKLAATCAEGEYLVKTVSGWTCSGTCVPTTEVCDGLDNNCDGQVDETFTDLGDACIVGIGVCQNSGIKVCNGAHDGTECSVSPGSSSTEVCNGLDDDCDGNIDNNLTPAPCPIQQGVCVGSSEVCQGTSGWASCGATTFYAYSADYESTEFTCDDLDNDCDGITDEDLTGALCALQDGVCAGTRKQCSSGAWQACDYGINYEVVEATCDGLDNDCDGQTDESWINTKGSGSYDVDTACGNCYTDCTAIYNKPNASGICEVSGTPACSMVCDSGYYDMNLIPADGCEFQLATNAIYVSTSDVSAVDDATCGLGPFGTGVINYPCRSITYGIQRAQTTGRTDVYVAEGAYYEDVVINNGINLRGGYNRVTWGYDPAANPSIIYGTSGAGHRAAVTASNITSPTTFDGFTIFAASATAPSSNSYGIYISNADELVITNNMIYAGAGAPGAPQPNGSTGADGADGNNAAGCNFQVHSSGSTIIPDGDLLGITDTIDVSEDCTVSNLSVDMYITHAYISDIKIELTSPSNTTVRLHDHTGGGTDNIYGNYPATLVVDGPGALSDFNGETISGTWILNAVDITTPDGGTIDEWGLLFDSPFYGAFYTDGSPCSASNNRQHANGGSQTCGGDDVSGGNGGGNDCAPVYNTETSGTDGTDGQPGGGALGGTAGVGGDAGDDGQLSGCSLILPSSPMDGVDGTAGISGLSGSGGTGCSAPVGSVVGGHWVANEGTNGVDGGHGGGGAGGGAGGGSEGSSCSNNVDLLGGHGGGGGSGACGGTGGAGGQSGGSSFGIFVVSGTAPVIQNNTIHRGFAGKGGDGRNGGTGGHGGIGGDGGHGFFGAGFGGRGGNGGDGGHGGGGGGGCGGNSFGIFTSGVTGSPDYCGAGDNNTVSGGEAGTGGSGGNSLGNAGNAGLDGTVIDCQYN